VSPRPLRVPVPSAPVGIVIALCAVLLLKWLAVLALIVGALVVLVRWSWRHRRPFAPEPELLTVPGPRSAEPDCTWCGLAGGHHDGAGRPVRPRFVHHVAAPRERSSAR
jgi:hypothetical protein